MRRITAVLVRELKAYFDSVVAYVVLLAFFLVTSWLTISSIDELKIASLRGFFDSLPALFLFFIPAIAMRLWSEEHKLGTIELLMTWPLRDWDLVLGKYLAGLSLVAVSLLMSSSFAFYVAAYGTPDYGPLITGYLAALLLGGAYLAIACFLSSLTENQIVAYVLSVVVSAFLYLAGLPELLSWLPPDSAWLIDSLASVGFGTRFASVARGVLDFGDILFYFSIIILILFSNVRSVGWHVVRTGSGSNPIMAGLVTIASFGATLFLFSGNFIPGLAFLALIYFLFLASPNPKTHRWLLRLTDNLLACALALVVSVQFSALADRFAWRWDLTEERLFSLSPLSSEILGKLEDPLELRCYFSGNLPPAFRQRRQQTVDLLNEFVDAGRGRVSLRFFDPDSDPSIRERAEEEGVRPVVVNVSDNANDRQVVKRTFGCVIEYQGGKETFEFMPDPSSLEADLTAAVRKLDSARNLNIGIFISSDKPPPALQQIDQALRQRLFGISRIDKKSLEGGAAIPKHLAALLVIGPEKLSEREAYEIDQFVMNGGKLVLLADGALMDIGKVSFNPIVTGLESVLTSWGFEVLPQVARDTDPKRCETMQFTLKGNIAKSGPNPFALRLSAKELDREHPVTATLESLSFNEASPIRILERPADAPGKVTVLARADGTAFGSKRLGSFARTLLDFVDSGPGDRKPERDEELKPALAVAYQGPLRSHFQGRQPPAPEGSLQGNAEDNRRSTIAETAEARIIIIGDSGLVDGSKWANYPSGGFALRSAQTLVLNALDWIADNGDLIPLRNRGLKPRSLTLPDNKSTLRRTLPVYLIAPLVLLGLALIRWLVLAARATAIGEELRYLAANQPTIPPRSRGTMARPALDRVETPEPSAKPVQDQAQEPARSGADKKSGDKAADDPGPLPADLPDQPMTVDEYLARGSGDAEAQEETETETETETEVEVEPLSQTLGSQPAVASDESPSNSKSQKKSKKRGKKR